MKSKAAMALMSVAAASTLAAGTIGPTKSLAAEADNAQDDTLSAAVVKGEATANAAAETEQHVEGTFSFSQGETDANTTIARVLGTVPHYLCGSAFERQAPPSPGKTDFDIRSITVTGAVQNSFTATLEQLASENATSLVLGCACGGDPADGKAHADAEITGVTVRSILEKAQVDETANTIAFISSDGYEVALPLSYVLQRYSLIVYEVNGESVDDVMGGANQLWLGATSARYFGRDITNIDLRAEADPPAAPGSQDGANTPNISISEGGVSS